AHSLPEPPHAARRLHRAPAPKRLSPSERSCPSLAEPAAHLLVVEDNRALAAREHDVEVAPTQRLLGPPAVDHAPLLANNSNRRRIHGPTRAVHERLAER